MNYRNPFKKTYRGIVRFPAMAGTFFGLATVALVSVAETAKLDSEKQKTPSAQQVARGSSSTSESK